LVQLDGERPAATAEERAGHLKVRSRAAVTMIAPWGSGPRLDSRGLSSHRAHAPINRSLPVTLNHRAGPCQTGRRQQQGPGPSPSLSRSKQGAGQSGSPDTSNGVDWPPERSVRREAARRQQLFVLGLVGRSWCWPRLHTRVSLDPIIILGSPFGWAWLGKALLGWLVGDSF